MSLTLLAGETTRVYGSGGMVVEGNKVTYCPNRDRIVCADVALKEKAHLSVGSLVAVKTPRSSKTFLLRVAAITGPFDRDGNIQGADIQFTTVEK
ncbi:hypothetical protein [Flavobacterium sp. JP2137]|uniref:hypothetical protein n=1 Tax=Flavobacterium sp. JP2137 TaxID=3414510 RepID=UPI003D2FFE53